MSGILQEFEEQLWDERNWLLSLKGDKPVEHFMEYLREKKSSKTAVSIDELPKEQSSWLRAK